jgi:hypothetical protein
MTKEIVTRNESTTTHNFSGQPFGFRKFSIFLYYSFLEGVRHYRRVSSFFHSQVRFCFFFSFFFVCLFCRSCCFLQVANRCEVRATSRNSGRRCFFGFSSTFRFFFFFFFFALEKSSERKQRFLGVFAGAFATCFVSFC